MKRVILHLSKKEIQQLAAELTKLAGSKTLLLTTDPQIEFRILPDKEPKQGSIVTLEQ